MKYTLSLDLEQDQEDIVKLLQADIENVKSSRSNIKIERCSEKTRITVESIDATSLRASTNDILKVLQVYEKTKGLKNGSE